jgi:adenine-specific DNA methylase
MSYPKRLIEVDLPIKRIGAYARYEKKLPHEHISTLHLWWARRPLAACRAVALAALWPDPADPACPPRFLEEARRALEDEVRKARSLDSATPLNLPTLNYSDPMNVRLGLLDFVAEFANWDNAANRDYLEFARTLVQVAHESLGGAEGTRPLVVDPFAGGGAIPLEALRVGADAFASDLNPVAVLLNKVVLEYIPKYGQRLADEVSKWGDWIKEQADAELGSFYPRDADGAAPIAYIWARTIRCEGPGCGAEVPLLRSLWLAKKGKRQRGSRSVALRLIPRPSLKLIDFEILQEAKPSEVTEGTVRRGSATCPICGFTTPVASVRGQLKERRGGASDPRMICVVTTRHVLD